MSKYKTGDIRRYQVQISQLLGRDDNGLKISITDYFFGKSLGSSLTASQLMFRQGQ